MKDSTKGTLYVLPSGIAEVNPHLIIPSHVTDLIPDLRYYLVENARTARRFLRSLSKEIVLEEIDFTIVDKNTDEFQITKLLAPLLDGQNMGLLSEAGMPAIADPGNVAVAAAHRLGIKVKPLVGPSSIILALAASGLNGQRFAFHGYLPIDKNDVVKRLKELEINSRKNDETQIFIETPYRNKRMLEAILRSCSIDTKLCIAADITGNNEYIRTDSIKGWRNSNFVIEKNPCVFLVYAS